MSRGPVCVEIDIARDVTELWERTQDPAQHVRWDLRFTRIAYLPRQDGMPQQFLYETRLGFGLRITGAGETATGQSRQTSALRFWSEDPMSLIANGSGCWVYLPLGGRVRFRTIYDYQVRYGWFGRLLDGLLFRPIMGWATAWSFDRLRLWLERGIPPEASLRMAAVHGLARLALATGLVAGTGTVGLVPAAAVVIWGRRPGVLAAGVLARFIISGGLAAAPAIFIWHLAALVALVLCAWLTATHAPAASRCRRNRGVSR